MKPTIRVFTLTNGVNLKLNVDIRYYNVQVPTRLNLDLYSGSHSLK